MNYPPGQYGESPEWQGQQPGWPNPQPGWPGPQPGYQGYPEPNNHLVWAILCTVLCCLPFGIASIVYSTKVAGLWSQGRYAEAHDASAKAKKWAIIGAVTGAVFIAISMAIYIVLIVATVSDTPTPYSGY